MFARKAQLIHKSPEQACQPISVKGERPPPASLHVDQTDQTAIMMGWNRQHGV